jgi:hypothetical protein
MKKEKTLEDVAKKTKFYDDPLLYSSDDEDFKKNK